jgi:hypothetical protein
MRFLSVQLEGSSALEQDGREARLGPGDFALYDTRRPYRLKVNASTAQLVLKIPRKALEALSAAGAAALLNLKAAIESSLFDPALTPSRAAAAAGISVRQANALLAQTASTPEVWSYRLRLGGGKAASRLA